MRVIFKADVKTFQTGAIRAIAAMRNIAPVVVLEALEQFKEDALNVPPMCPIDTGWLYNHHQVSLTMHKGDVTGGVLRVVDTPYAASLHEGISRWGTPYTKFQRPGAGPKWIESKSVSYDRKYAKIMSRGLWRAFKNFWKLR